MRFSSTKRNRENEAMIVSMFELMIEIEFSIRDVSSRDL